MNKFFTKVAAFSACLAMAIGVGVAVGSGDSKNQDTAPVEAASGTFTKITSAPSDWSGEYVIVYESGSTAYCWTGVDAASCYATATISSGSITGPANACTVTIAKMTGGYSVMVNGGTNDGKYIANNGSSNGIKFNNSASVTTLTYENNSVTMTCGGKKFRYNSASGNYRFRYFGSAQQVIQLYKKAASGYTITPTITNGTSSGDTSIASGGTASVTITPNSGFKLPNDVTVTGATKSYNSTTGVVSLSNPTGNVTITATCPALQSYSVTKTITHGSATGATSIYENGNATVTISPDTGYKLPSSVSVSGATSEYNSTTGVVSLSNPTGNVTVSATMDAATQYSVGYSLTNLNASPSPTTMYENEEVSITLSVTDSTKYALPATITVTNSTGYGYNSSTGVITLHGSQGNVTITASAIAKPAEESEEFDFTDSNLWIGSEKNANDKFTVYTRTVNLVTMTWDTNGQSSLAGAYWNPGRVYVGHKVTISALTGQGAVTTIKSVTFHGVSGYTAGTNGATKTVTQPTSGAGTISSEVSGTDIIYTITGTVTEFNLVVSGSQTRWSTVEVVYMKDQSDVTLNSISATCDPVLVSQTIKPIITFNPQNASNKNVTYAIVENTGNLASVAEDGTITGLGNGTARLRITPEDTNADAITIDVTVNALPSVYGVEVGKKYAMVKDNYELSGIYESAVPNYGTVASYSDNPEGSFPIRVVNGLYARTVALQVEINSETKYLSYDAEANGNSLNYVGEVNRESSWIFAEVDSALVIKNVEVYGRHLAFASNRFACYQALTSSIVTPDFVELAEAKSDKEYVQDFVDLYMHMIDYTENKGWCSDGEHSYYLTAKAGYNSIIYGIAAREALWTGDSDFAAAKLRYETWAVKNNDNDPYDGNNAIVDKIDPSKSNMVLESILGQSGSTVAIIVISVVGISAIGGYFLLRKRKED